MRETHKSARGWGERREWPTLNLGVTGSSTMESFFAELRGAAVTAAVWAHLLWGAAGPCRTLTQAAER